MIRSRTSNRSSQPSLQGSVGVSSPPSEHPAIRAARRTRKERRELKGSRHGFITCFSHFSEICQTNCSVFCIGVKDSMLNFVQSIFKPSGYKKQKPQELVKQMADELEALPDVIEETANTNSVTGMTSKPSVLASSQVSLSTSKSFQRSPSSAGENETKKYAPLEDFLAAAVIPSDGRTSAGDHKPDTHAGPPTQFGNVTSTRKPPKPEEIEKVVNQSLQSNLLLKIARHIAVASPELRRSCVQVWGHLLKLESPKNHEKVNLAYLMTHPDCMRCLVSCYSIPDCSMHVGVMIRDACKFHEVVQSQMFNSGLIYQLFDVLHSHNFDTQADGFETLKEVLMNHKDVSVRWLLDNFDEFFNRYVTWVGPSVPAELLDASSGDTQYVTVRQSLKLLGDILLDRPFMKVMVRFVNEERFLKSVMILLGDSSKAVQVEAFHVFKIFAANPHKAPAVQQILYQNRTRLIKLLDKLEMAVISSTGVHKSQSEEKQFVADKQAVVNKLEKLTMPERIGHHHHGQQQRDSSSGSPESERRSSKSQQQKSAAAAESSGVPGRARSAV
ncbi:Calcium-binding protein 39 [Perkinsus olseni]|uniref:Calcium-binding protein 39 n=2 Tax=Perkinsus olseni TaxID=32597 RepID=A0A7J6UI17_PEROL|nr:Calcium-binding protein 39 [Perkinsus olseni]